MTTMERCLPPADIEIETEAHGTAAAAGMTIRISRTVDFSEKGLLEDGAATFSEVFVKCFLRVPQAVWLYCSCHAAQASKGNF